MSPTDLGPMRASVPAGMVRVPAEGTGRVVVLGPYESDPAALGRREVYLDPVLVDVNAAPGLSAEACAARGGRLAFVAELEHALRLGLVARAAGAERTASLATPVDAEALAAVEGSGTVEVWLESVSRMRLMPLEETPAQGQGQGQARCVVPVAAPPARIAMVVHAAVDARRGRGTAWPPMTSFRALSDEGRAPVPTPAHFAEGSIVYVIHEDAGWRFVAAFPLAEGIGWVPAANLAAPSK